MCLHIFRVYSPSSTQAKKLWKVISKFLWSSKSNEGIRYRYKVASKQIELKFWQGGLKILKTENQSISINSMPIAQPIACFKPCPYISPIFPGYILCIKFYKVDFNFLHHNFGVKSLQSNF